MREIKFRVWDKKEMIMNTPDFLPPTTNKTTEFYRRWVIMQSTGLHDKNGKEIFEGDIVKVIWCSKAEEKREEYEDGNYYYGLVNFGYVVIYMSEYYNQQFYLDVWFPKVESFKKRRNKIEYESLFNESIKKVEVIGNKFENGDLLNGRN